MQILNTIASELNLPAAQIVAAVKLLDEGATVPFIARYRKEVTGGLTDTDLRNLVERLTYLRELDDRRQTILKSIDSQGKLDEKLKTAIEDAKDKVTLEDLYLPYKPKRRTKAQIAIEAGLEPLADQLLTEPTTDPQTEAANYLNAEHKIDDTKAALEGAKQILMERFSENADLIAQLRQSVTKHGVLTSRVIKGKEQEGQKFTDYFEYDEPFSKVPSHRALALFRGRNEGFLRIGLTLDEVETHNAIRAIASTFGIADQGRAADSFLMQVVNWTWKIKFHLKLELELLQTLREEAELQAIHVFQDNLKNLLMAAPAGNKAVLGLDPGLRTGVKVVVVDGTGKLLTHTTIFPHAPRNQWAQSIEILAKLCVAHQIDLVSIGNGTASRETDKLVAELMRAYPALRLTKVVVSEAGASVYSASEFAAKEFPDLDVSFRGAVSIARRLQDPLAELVKIDPKSIGVGQYQHDVNQIKLSRSLTAVLEDCVNAVGADVNTASVPVLKSIAGLNETLANNIVSYREQHGRFTSREQLSKIPRLGPKTYEQAIGFLRIIEGDNPLDASAVHPESYAVVDSMRAKSSVAVSELIGNEALINQINPNDYVDDEHGLPTIKDILNELKKPGRDPRPSFKVAEFKEGVETINDLKVGMILEGVISNVANFGAFVDIGVHQDGLVHVSQISHNFIKDIHSAVKVGEIVKVKVMEVDVPRKRISLSMRLDDKVGASTGKPSNRGQKQQQRGSYQTKEDKPVSDLASKLMSALSS